MSILLNHFLVNSRILVITFRLPTSGIAVDIARFLNMGGLEPEPIIVPPRQGVSSRYLPIDAQEKARRND